MFEWERSTGTIVDVASFDGSNGANPYAGMILDDEGNFFGTTSSGGASGDGTVFELVPSGAGTYGAGHTRFIRWDQWGNSLCRAVYG